MARLLVVDDEPAICWGLARLAKDLGHEAVTAGSAEEALALVASKVPDLMLLDVRLPGMDGLTAIEHLRLHLGRAPIIVMTAYGDLNTAVEAVRRGAFEYLIKPFDLATAERTIVRALAAQHDTSSSSPPLEVADDDALVGRSAAMQEVFKQIALVSASEACVHLFGESGTGKELAARAIHRYSRRAGGPFVAVNLASLSESLAESELFGHARNAFTGANTARRGLLEQAHGGTIFLDEVADIPLALQAKLLRALEYGEVLPVGASEPMRTDFRVISATHQDLSRLVADGRFRHDLFFRLNTFEIRLPALRERTDDIALLAMHFLGRFTRRADRAQPAGFTPDALAELARRPWHGNVRELRNAIEHALVLARDETIRPEHLPTAATAAPGEPVGDLRQALRAWATAHWQPSGEATDVYQQLLELVEPPVLAVALEQHQGQCAAAARSLGLHRVTLRKKLQSYGLSES